MSTERVKILNTDSFLTNLPRRFESNDKLVKRVAVRTAGDFLNRVVSPVGGNRSEALTELLTDFGFKPGLLNPVHIVAANDGPALFGYQLSFREGAKNPLGKGEYKKAKGYFTWNTFPDGKQIVTVTGIIDQNLVSVRYTRQSAAPQETFVLDSVDMSETPGMVKKDFPHEYSGLITEQMIVNHINTNDIVRVYDIKNKSNPNARFIPGSILTSFPKNKNVPVI